MKTMFLAVVGCRKMGTAADCTPIATNVVRVIRRHDALIALAMIVMLLTSWAATDGNAFLGPAYDGPTAAYGYNLP
jgi:hypothetical protein